MNDRNYIKVWKVFDLKSGKYLRSYRSVGIYVRKSDAIKRANLRNRLKPGSVEVHEFDLTRVTE